MTIRMKHVLLPAVACGLAILSSANGAAESVVEKNKSFLVTYPDGMQETILVLYAGLLDADEHVEGSSSKPLEGHWVDDRRCIWHVDTTVTRQVYFVSRSGNQAAIGPLTHTFDRDMIKSRGPTSGIEVFYHRSCGDVQTQIDGEVADAKSSLIAGFDDIVANDVKELDQDLRDFLHPIRIRAAELPKS